MKILTGVDEAGPLDHLGDGHELVALLVLPARQNPLGRLHRLAPVVTHRSG